MCLAQGHSTVTLVRLEHETLQSRVKDSDDEVFGWQAMTIIIRLLQATFC